MWDSTVELAQLIDRLGLYSCEGLKFAVRIVDSKLAYGRLLLLITPYAPGRATRAHQDSFGVRWVNASKVEPLQPAGADKQ